jgi:hypothetical protein
MSPKIFECPHPQQRQTKVRRTFKHLAKVESDYFVAGPLRFGSGLLCLPYLE